MMKMIQNRSANQVWDITGSVTEERLVISCEDILAVRTETGPLTTLLHFGGQYLSETGPWA